MGRRKQYTQEFKESAVRLVVEQGRTMTDVAQSLGITIQTVSNWVKAKKAQGKEAFRGHGKRTAIEQELYDLRKRVKELEEDKEILKKTSIWLARELGTGTR